MRKKTALLKAEINHIGYEITLSERAVRQAAKNR